MALAGQGLWRYHVAMNEPMNSLESGDMLRLALDWRAAGRKVALATVVEAKGSAPRPVGSRLVVDGQGNFEGSVSGGCVEGDVIAAAADVIATGRPRLMEFGPDEGVVWRSGLACGGGIRVLVEAVDDEAAVTLARLSEHRRKRLAVIEVVETASATRRLVDPANIAADSLADALTRRLAEESSGMENDSYVNIHLPDPLLYLVGAVHIAQFLAPMAAMAGHRVTMIDPREAFADPARFPGIDLVVEWPDETLAAAPLDDRSAVVTLSHEPRIDDPALIAALRSPCYCIAALGSRRTHASRLERLAREGFDAASLERIHGPAGLDIGARGPAEIAISVIAQLTACLRRGESA